jgi:alkanesulfonate monooxygenase SsuD/methylene tetrahydromethanopterin reductase-like flavin-dependent oxidoreductase (luciferase family)
MWTQEEATFEGTYYQVHGAINQPKGVQQPHIPMLIGGSGEKVTLKLVAQYGDACNVAGDPAMIAHKLALLKEHCGTVGRDYESIRRTISTMVVIADTDEQAIAQVPAMFRSQAQLDMALVGTLETVRARLKAYEAVGVQELIIVFPDAVQGDSIRRFAEAFIA